MDEADLRSFIQGEYPRIVGSISAICGSRATAEDSVQEALLRAWERTEHGEDISSLGAWVTTVALNLSQNRVRHLAVEWRSRHRLGDQEGRDPRGLDGDRVDVAKALMDLPRRQREAVVLHYYLGYDVAGVSELMGAPPGTVKSLLSRARRTLSSTLADHDPRKAADR